MTKNFKNLNDDFQDFLSAPEMEPPAHVREKILAMVQADLNPSRKKIFMKIAGLHALVSVFSLSLCSQFGFQTFKLFDAMETFMKVMGHTYCQLLCGGFYFAMSTLVFSFTLTPEEIRAIRKDRYAQLFVLAGVSIGVFLCLNSEVLVLPGLLWMTGSVVGGLSAFELGWKLRSKFRQALVYGI